MKKGLLLLMGAAVVFMSGCDREDVLRLLNPAQDVTVTPEAEPEERIYIDEVQGVLEDFNGNQITLATEDGEVYFFDVSGASLECKAGMIVGDQVSVIYEGHLSGTDTSQVRALKVVDEVHKKEDLKESMAQGEIQALTSNTVTIKNKAGETAVYPIVGTEQYYQSGVKKGTWVYIHYKGRLLSQEGDSKVLDATHLKVVRVSDLEPMVVAPPEPTATPAPRTDSEAQADKGYLGGTVVQVKDQTLQILPDGAREQRTISMETARIHFYGGMAPGTHVTVWYDGEAGEKGEIAARAIYEDDPATLRETEINNQVTGTVTTITANTVTIQTEEGIPITCDTTGARNKTAGGITPGGKVAIVFDPLKSKETNIYAALSIMDA